jgi:hypothetical protein
VDILPPELYTAEMFRWLASIALTIAVAMRGEYRADLSDAATAQQHAVLAALQGNILVEQRKTSAIEDSNLVENRRRNALADSSLFEQRRGNALADSNLVEHRHTNRLLEANLRRQAQCPPAP